MLGGSCSQRDMAPPDCAASPADHPAPAPDPPHGAEQRSVAQQFAEDGYICPLHVLSPPEAAAALAELNAFAASSCPGGEICGDARFKVHLYLPFASRLVRHPAILDAVESALGTRNLLLWSSDLNIKPAGSGGFFSEHQDATYTGLAPAGRGVTVWLALSDPVDEEHGCMLFRRGSHLGGQLPHVEEPGLDAHNMLSRGQRVEPSPAYPWAQGSEVTASLRGGEASIHHFHLVHRSAPNRGRGHRVGLAMRFVAASVRQTGQAREMVTLVRGEAEHDGFDLEPDLPMDASEEERAAGRRAHAEAMQREKDNYFAGARGVTGYDERGRRDDGAGGGA